MTTWQGFVGCAGAHGGAAPGRLISRFRGGQADVIAPPVAGIRGQQPAML